MDCKTFRDRIAHFQADEVEGDERRGLQAHLNACRACADRLEFEDELLAALRTRLPRVPAPPGLETRVRAALRAEGEPTPEASPAGGFGMRWSWLWATAAVVLLGVAVAPRLLQRGPASDGAAVRIVEQVVLVVDAECDRHGKSLEAQRQCRHPRHFNRLKLDDGGYWDVSLDGGDGARVVLTPDMRGRRVLVAGDLYPEIRTLRLRRLEFLDQANARPPRGPRRRDAGVGWPLAVASVR